MAVTLPLKPFPSPNPNATNTVDPNIVRANDNALRDAVNQLLQAVQSGLVQSDSVGRTANLYDPRFAPNDGDHIIASLVFGRYRA